MKPVLHSLRRAMSDDGGAEVIEYALVVGLVIIAAVATITSFGTKVFAKWTSINASM